MVKLLKIWLLFVPFLFGCNTLYIDPVERLRGENRQNLDQLEVGLSRERVLEIMGTDPAKGIFMWVKNPFRTETLTGKSGTSYEVLYYYTQLRERDDKITDDELTPLVFEKDILVGWGYEFLDKKVPQKPVLQRR